MLYKWLFRESTGEQLQQGKFVASVKLYQGVTLSFVGPQPPVVPPVTKIKPIYGCEIPIESYLIIYISFFASRETMRLASWLPLA